MTRIADLLDDVVHEDTQAREDAFDLTVATIGEIAAPGRVDFGGGELQVPKVQPRPTEKRNPDDDHGWWNLPAGQYLIEYNETFAGGRPLVLQPRRALVEAGASHPTLVVDEDLPRLPLSVGGAGIEIKENARVSTLVVYDGG